MSESQLHRDLKQWVAEKYSKYPVEFERRIWGNSKVYDQTTVDVFVHTTKGIAVYCQTHCIFSWADNFVNRCIPIIKRYAKRQIVVFPENIEYTNPRSWKKTIDLLTKVDVDIKIAPLKIELKRNNFFVLKIPVQVMDKWIDKKNRITSKTTSVLNWIDENMIDKPLR